MRKRNIYWDEDTDAKAKDLAWMKRMSVSQLLADLVSGAAKLSQIDTRSSKRKTAAAV